MIEGILITLGVAAFIAFLFWAEWKGTNKLARDMESDDPKVRDRAFDHW